MRFTVKHKINDQNKQNQTKTRLQIENMKFYILTYRYTMCVPCCFFSEYFEIRNKSNDHNHNHNNCFLISLIHFLG